MPASLTILPHLPSWTLTKSSSSLGELENASKPTLPRLDFTSLLSMILRSSALSSVMMSAGVPAGAKMPVDSRLVEGGQLRDQRRALQPRHRQGAQRTRFNVRQAGG